VKYLVQVEIEASNELEQQPGGPARIQEWIGKWQALNPIGMYFTLTRRSVTIIVDVPNEDAMFEALYDTWQITKSYPAVTPVVGAEEFGSMMQRIGLGG
jgi:hypothetical protein